MEDDEIFKLHKRDSRNLSDIVPPDSVTTTITSPPYADLKDYGYAEQIGHGDSYETYLSDIKDVFSQVYSVTEDNGSLWIIVDTFKRDGNITPLPFDIAEELKDTGWYFQDIIIWNKTKTLPWSKKGQMRNIFEYILFFTKSKDDFKYFIDDIREPEDIKKWWVRFPERYNPKGKIPDNIWEHTIPTQGSWKDNGVDHFNPFPPSLIEKLIFLSTEEGDVVMDPFAGTGTTLAQADVMGRNYIGFELNDDYIDMFHESVTEEVKERWEQRQEELPERERSQKILKSQIKKLRRLKFPKTLVRRLILDKDWSEEELHLNAIFVLQNDKDEIKFDDDHKFLSIDLRIVTDNGFSLSDFEQDIEEAVSQPPLSKFGINPVVDIHNTDDFPGECPDLEEESLWLYSRGKVNKYHSSFSLDEWREQCTEEDWEDHFRNGVPPIISDIKVNQEVPEDE